MTNFLTFTNFCTYQFTYISISTYLADPKKAWATLEIPSSFSDPLVKIYLRRRHAQKINNGAFSQKKKKNFIAICLEILDLEVNKNDCIGSKVKEFCWNGEFCLLVELHQKGSAPAGWASDLFYYFFHASMVWSVLLWFVIVMFWIGLDGNVGWATHSESKLYIQILLLNCCNVACCRGLIFQFLFLLFLVA